MSDIITTCSSCGGGMRQIPAVIVKGHIVSRNDGLTCKGQAPTLCVPCIEQQIDVLPSWCVKERTTLTALPLAH